MWIPSCLYSGNPYVCGLYIETGPWSFRSGVSNLPLLGYAGLTACHLLSPWKVLVSDSVQRWGPLPHARCLPAHPQGVPHAPLMTQQRKWRENAASRADSESGVSPVCSPSGNNQVTYLTPRPGPLGTKYKPLRLRPLGSVFAKLSIEKFGFSVRFEQQLLMHWEQEYFTRCMWYRDLKLKAATEIYFLFADCGIPAESHPLTR